MGIQNKTLKLIINASQVLEKHNPMTLRQLYYQLVAKHIIENKRSEYQKLSSAIVKARQEGIIPWEWIEDRGRQPRTVNMWKDLPDFINTVKNAYRKDIWKKQNKYIEVWLEKDALSGIFSDITDQYGITLCVGRGYNSWSAYKEATDRFTGQDKPVTILYFGDFDPSGEDIVRVLKESLNYLGTPGYIREAEAMFGMKNEFRELQAFDNFGTSPEIIKVALAKQDVVDYDLPPDFTKKTDSRSKTFIEKYGDIAVELDALPLPVLQQKIKESIENVMDMEALYQVMATQEKEQEELANLLS